MPIQSPSCLDAAPTRLLFAVASRRRVQPHHDHPLISSDNRPAPPHFHYSGAPQALSNSYACARHRPVRRNPRKPPPISGEHLV